MNGDVEEEAPRPRPLSAGIWTLFSWLRRTDHSSSSESVTSVGSDRTVASFDFLAPVNYKIANTPLVLPQGPFTDTYKKRLHERNLRRQRDRGLTLCRKYGLFREEGLGYDAFSLPSARRLDKDSIIRKDRERRATSESIQRRSAYVPGKRRAPLPPTVAISASLPRTYKRKRPAPKPPIKLLQENKENLEINKVIQMNPTVDVGKHSFLNNDTVSEKKSDKHCKPETKEFKLRTDKSFLKQIFDNKKRNSAIETSHIKLLPSISELDKQAAEIVEANKLLRDSRGNNSSYMNDESKFVPGTEDTWICTTCLRKYKSVVKCCIYCLIKENSSNNKIPKTVPTNASNICTQTDEKSLKLTNCETDDKKKLREMLKEMKDSLPKRPKHNDKIRGENKEDRISSTETPTLRVGSTIDKNMKDISNIKYIDSQNQNDIEHSVKNTKTKFLMAQPSSSKQVSLNFVTSFNRPITNRNFLDLSTSVMPAVKQSPGNSKEILLTKKVEQTDNQDCSDIKIKNVINKSPDIRNINKLAPMTLNNSTKSTNVKLDNKSNNVKTNEVTNSKNLLLQQQNENTIKVLDPPVIISKNSEKLEEITEQSESVKCSKIIANEETITKNQSSILGVHNNIARIELGNIYPANVVKIEKVESDLNLNSSRNVDLHTPLKISSLLNPLYCPKYQSSNKKVSDCNFGKVLETKDTIKESNENEEKSSNVQIIVQNITAAPSINVQTPSTSSTKLLNIELQKSEANSMKMLIEKKTGITVTANEDIKNKIVDFNSSNIVKNTNEPAVKVLDHHDRRRNLINQLEQAILKGDEQLAAEAAAKLAKLKLACSVLSFSSHIVAEVIPNKTDKNLSKDNNIPEKENTNQSVTSNIRQIDSTVTLNNNFEMENLNQCEVPKPIRTTSAHKEIGNNFPEPSTSTYNQTSNDEIVPIDIWVEDKEAARGPIPLRISRKSRIGQLKQQVEMCLGLEIPLQRWIVGKTLCTDDNALVVNLAGQDFRAPFYLCLVESETKNDNSPQIKDDINADSNVDPSQINNDPSSDVYTELMKLEQQALVPNTEELECGVCIEQCAIGAGAVLRECIHTFCKECLADVVKNCEEPVVACPAVECSGTLQEREIRALLTTEEHDRWLARSLAAAESGTRNTFHCRTPDCQGWAFCEPGVRRFPCPVCKHTNCVPCQAVHEGETCEQYQVKLRVAIAAAETNQTDEGTQALLKSLISRGEALECPECNAIITKKWGCDWIKCSACKTEICWITKGRRWGPGGKGDTSGGCRCGIDGKRCHPSCGYCH